ncbi:DUF2306 domain-containing protein [Streptosporangium sp. NPDC051022]|uniref:DUF2306 domain-containing protein n=1 Tax=Streptosporangium sp. NPDC051022 TaxID=3155752 RepID=UPI00343D7AE2
MTDESTMSRRRFPPSPRSGRPAEERGDSVEDRSDSAGDRSSAGALPASSTRAGRFVPAALILLSAVPIVMGAVRLNELTGGAAITPENARFFAVPLPVVTHILCVSLYCVLGAFQFAPGLRRRRPGLHRAAGWLLVPCGLAAALTGLWMTLFYPRPVGDGDLLTAFRLVFGTAMTVSIVLGLAAIRRRDIARHRAWMTRGYAIGLGAGTQVLTQLLWFLFLGFGSVPGEFARALLVGAGWVINLAVAEWFLRRRPIRSSRTPVGSSGTRLSS